MDVEGVDLPFIETNNSELDRQTQAEKNDRINKQLKVFSFFIYYFDVANDFLVLFLRFPLV